MYVIMCFIVNERGVLVNDCHARWFRGPLANQARWLYVCPPRSTRQPGDVKVTWLHGFCPGVEHVPGCGDSEPCL